MLDKIIRILVVGVVVYLAYWGLSIIVIALSGALGFAYAELALAIIAGLLIIGFCIFVLRVFGVSI